MPGGQMWWKLADLRAKPRIAEGPDARAMRGYSLQKSWGITALVLRCRKMICLGRDQRQGSDLTGARAKTCRHLQRPITVIKHSAIVMRLAIAGLIMTATIGAEAPAVPPPPPPTIPATTPATTPVTTPVTTPQMPPLPGPLEAGWHGSKVCVVLNENARVRALRCTFPPGVGHERHFHAAHWGYIIAGSTMKVTSATGTVVRELKAGDSWWSDGFAWHEGLNIGKTTGVYIIVEPKLPAE